MTTDYAQFLASKRHTVPAVGRTIDPSDIHPMLFPFQRDLVCWAVRKGRAAIFADTGLGKTFMQLEWARLTGNRSLIIAPLSVARQTVRDAAKLGIEATYARSQVQAITPITVTNYEMVDAFDPALFDAVVLDESSILKSLDGKTRKRLTALFAETPYRLCCTATPAPNDIAEIANHAAFLGVMSREEMLAAFFIHDTEGWRLKGHAAQPFYRWLASWGMSVRLPSDLGYSDEGYLLPSLNITPDFIETDYRPDGMLFSVGLHGIGHRSSVRRHTVDDRIQRAAELVGDGNQWILWCGLNTEADKLAALIPGAVNVQGSDTFESKVANIEAFQDGLIRVLITKVRIAGFGMNLQNCSRMAFVGLNDSWEQYYQAIRRCWRFGQTEPVEAHIILSNAEQDIYHNVMRKEEEASRMREGLIEHVREYEREEIATSHDEQQEYRTGEASGDKWRMLLGDSSERLREIESDSIDLSIYSPPFASLYTYSPTERDIGNSASRIEFFAHYRFIIREVLRATKQGRNTCVHVANLVTTLSTHGVIGLYDFRGDVIRAYVDEGWTYHGEVCIDKDPQAQAIRTHSKGLLFVQFHKDSAASRPALADYILIFQKPGQNVVPIHPELTNDEWIEFARPIWYGIRESDTLNVRIARENDDERHIAPLQLGTIERCVKLWSNRGDLVLSPFAGIGSEGYVSLKHGRRFVGIELKESYWKTTCTNLAKAEQLAAGQLPMFKEDDDGGNATHRNGVGTKDIRVAGTIRDSNPGE